MRAGYHVFIKQFRYHIIFLLDRTKIGNFQNQESAAGNTICCPQRAANSFRSDSPPKFPVAITFSLKSHSNCQAPLIRKSISLPLFHFMSSLEFQETFTETCEKSRSYTTMRRLNEYIRSQPEKTANNWRGHHWFPRQMTSEKRAQKFHTDDASLLQIWVVLLIGRAAWGI